MINGNSFQIQKDGIFVFSSKRKSSPQMLQRNSFDKVVTFL